MSNTSIDLNRRELFGVAAIAATTFAIAASAAESPALAPAFSSSTELKPLPFDPAKLKGLSERLLKSHWENNYGGSVRALAAVKQRLAAAASDKDLPAYLYNEIKREH